MPPRGDRGVKVGYARVSTMEQNLDLQQGALKDVGCDLILTDKASGGSARRPGLRKALRRCARGDILVVWKLDRLGRSLAELVELIETLKSRGVGLRVLTGQGAMLDTTRAEGRLIFGIFAALAEFERELIRERTRAGMAAARQRGVHLGRPSKLGPSQIRQAMKLLASGRPVGETAARFGVHPNTLRRAIRMQDRT